MSQLSQKPTILIFGHLMLLSLLGAIDEEVVFTETR
jgi:hypothetical protein